MKRAWVRAVPHDGRNFWRVVVYVSGGGVLHTVLFATHTDALRYARMETE